MDVWKYFVVMVTLLAYCQCKNCVTKDRCTCVFDDDSGMVELWSIARTDGTPLFYDYPSTQDIYLYSYNPCYGFSEGACADVAVCQYDYQFVGYYDLGTQDNVDFSYDGLNVVAIYTSADGGRFTHVTLVCDPTATEATVDVNGESVPLNYYMTVTSAAACVIPAPGGNGGISGGSVILIIFFVLLAVYLISGVAFNKVKRGASGKELVPNIEFWTMIPGLVKDGCAFVVGKICRRRSVYTSM